MRRCCDEREGLDAVLHGEEGYALGTSGAHSELRAVDGEAAAFSGPRVPSDAELVSWSLARARPEGTNYSLSENEAKRILGLVRRRGSSIRARVGAMAEPAHHRFSFDEYLTVEEDSGIKHEFLNGQVWAMSGGTPDHAAMAGNVLTLLNVQLSGKRCRVFTSDLRIRVVATGLGTYPDVSVVCGHLELDPEDSKRHTVVNPRILVEVLSPSTEAYDRGEKLRHYQQIASVEEIVLVAYDRREVEVVRREPDGSWSRHAARDGETMHLSSVACELPVGEVYRDPLGKA